MNDAVKPDEDLVECQAETPIRYNGKDYAVGDPMALDADTFERLHAKQAVSVPEPTAGDDETDKDANTGSEGSEGGEGKAEAPTEPAERLSAIKEAIAGLDLSVDANKTTDGRPDCNALTEALGWKVGAAERDEAWAAVKAEADGNG